MTKHNQTKSLGTLADFQSAPEPTPETTDQRVDQLERRLTQAETLLNDVMQQLDRPYRDQPLFDGKPHGNGKPNPVKPKQAKPKQAKPQQTKPKRVNPPPLPPATESQTQAHAEAAITFLSQYPDKLWHGAKLRTAVKDHCATSNQKAILAMKLLRRTGHLVIVKDVEVCGETLDGAYKFIPQPEPPENPDEKQAKEAAKRLAAKQAKQARKEKNDALVIAQKATTAQLAAEALEKLLSILDNGDRITTKELIDMGISKKQQQRMQKSDAYKESGIQYQKLPDESHEYSIETTD